MEKPMLQPAATQVDLNALAKTTLKTFERLAPFSQLQTPRSAEATPIVIKIIKKVTGYLKAIDSSILAVQIAHRLSSDAVALCNLAAEQDDQDSSLAIISTEAERRSRLDRLLKLAGDAHEKVLEGKADLREVQQDLYKIAALTKDNTSIIQIPVDPARPKTIQRLMKDVGTDLVANLGVLTELSNHISQLADWCGAIKADLIAGGLSPTLDQTSLDGTDPLADLQSVRTQWYMIKDSTSEYYSMVGSLHIRYPHLLSASTMYWQLANEGKTYRKPKVGKARVARALVATRKASDLIRDGAMNLACHASFI